MAFDLLHLVNGGHTAVFGIDGGLPELLHLGAVGGNSVDPAIFSGLIPPGGLDEPARPELVTDPGRGWFGEPGLVLVRDGRMLTPRFKESDRRVGSDSASFSYSDEHERLSLSLDLHLGRFGDLVVSASIANTGSRPIGVDALNVTIPVPARLDRMLTFGGRHAMEFVEEPVKWGRSIVTIASRRGRTSHQQSPTVFCAASTTGETSGDAWGVHLSCHGNHRLVCDAVNADRRTITCGEILSPGETVLERGGTYSTPDTVVVASTTGFNGVTHALHGHIRSTSPPVTGHRPVIVNTWEAVYFDHDPSKLYELARRAARVGAERFVLDDGWFLHRRNDTAGLGDWEVDPQVWPQGLSPLAQHVNSLGMDFGIWVEPEMVSPDSDLYRAHPEWVLGESHQHAITGRNQLVLDLAIDEVRTYLVERLDGLLSDLPVAHVKWDHNRDLVAPGAHHQAAGLDEVLVRLRSLHPSVHFESCASGGGRIDASMARNVVRFWTSDSIDALDRMTIQRGAVRVIPPEMLGAHVGAPVCHTTGRRHSLSFRALSALPFWMGIEWDLLGVSNDELDRLASIVEVHKEHRDLFHTGSTIIADHPDTRVHVHGTVSTDLERAMFVVANLANGPRHVNAPVCLPGLDPRSSYRCEIVPLDRHTWALHRRLPDWVVNGVTADGRQLETIGLPWPPLLPESGMLVRLDRIA